ncbi:13328_t:CDS:10, partial [Racocetra persica]
DEKTRRRFGKAAIFLTDQVSKMTQQNKHLFSLTIGDLAAEFPAEPEKGLRHYLALAYNNQPSVLLLENIELFFPINGDNPLLAYYFRELLDKCFKEKVAISIIGTSTNIDSISQVARSIFEDEIEFGTLTPMERLEILETCTKNLDLASDVDIKNINDKCHGFVAADVVSLCRMAAEHSDAKSIQQTGEPCELKIYNADFLYGLQKIRISGLQEKNSVQKVESVKWSDIGGLEEVKSILEESVIWIYKHVDDFRNLGIKPSNGVLLYGPPGTGKTLLAKAVATESSANFIPVSIPDLIKGEVGESEKAIANIFKLARRCSPCIIFLDELEAMFGTKESSGSFSRKIISQLLLELDQLDSVDQGVVVLSSTNNPRAIDPSLLRPGRIDRLVYIKPPSFSERISILQIQNVKMKFSKSVNLREIAEKTENFTGADLKALVQRAALLRLKKYKAGERQLNLDAEPSNTRTYDEILKFVLTCFSIGLLRPLVSLKPRLTYPEIFRGFASFTFQQTSDQRTIKNNDKKEPETDFGFKNVPESMKETLVGQVFTNVASKYDVMNDAMSLGIHRLWKDHFIRTMAPGPGTKLLDVAGGTGDIAMGFLNYCKEIHGDSSAQVTLLDINPKMVDVGRERFKKTPYHQRNAENLSAIPSNSFDVYTIAFGIRNCTHIDRVLSEAYRVLRSGGRFMCLEFGKVQNPIISTMYNLYSFQIIPVLGQVIAADRDSYQYLVESIQRFPSQDKFAEMIKSAGFTIVGNGWEDLTFGVAAIHSGFKF